MSTDPNRRFYDEVAQTLSAAALRQVQDERLREAVQRAYDGAPFFRKRMDAVGVDPHDIGSVDDIVRLPICKKDDLRQSEIDFPPFGDYRCRGLDSWMRISTSTGTTGKPTFAAWTKNDLELEYELSARASWRLGLRPGMVVVTAQPGYLIGADAFIIGDCQHMGMLPISLGPPESLEAAARSLRAIQGIPIDHWRVFPSALHRFREAAEKYDIDIDLPEGEQGGPGQLFHKMSAGQECISVFGGTCGNGRGAHIAEDFGIAEVLDVDSLQPVAGGERGVLVATSLGRDNPMIRYNVEDIVRIESSPCDCGETTRRGFYQGRMKDVVRVDGRMILPIDVWFELPDEAAFALVRRPEAKSLVLRVEGHTESDLKDRLETRLGVPVDIDAVPEGSLPRYAYKPVQVVDEP